MISGFSARRRKYGLLADSSTIEGLEVFSEDESICGRIVGLEFEAMIKASRQRITEDTL